MSVPLGVFSATVRFGSTSKNVGGSFEPSPVLPVPDADQSLGVSPFSAFTCTAYSVSSVSEPMGAIVPIPDSVVSVHGLLPETLCRSV